MKNSYTNDFKEQAIIKALQRGDKTLEAVASELNISCGTLKDWLKTTRKTMPMSTPPKSPSNWSRAERLTALLESARLDDEERNAYCREKGLYSHHLSTWKAEFMVEPSAKQAEKSLLAENKQLKKELARKDQALAEAAALLVLQKKYQAFWEEKA